MNGAPVHSTQTWSTIDADGSASSGSLRKESTSTSPTSSMGSERCFPVVEGTTYAFGAKVYFPSTQSRFPRAGLYLGWFDATTSCESNPAGYFTSDNPGGVIAGQPGTDFATWIPLTFEATAPAGARQVVLGINGSGGDGSGNAIIHFDHVFLI